jgi:phage terminase large subunit-like protein
MEDQRSTNSKAQSLASLPEQDRKRALAKLTEAEADALLHHWEFWARENQLTPPGDWSTWLLLAGRGFGKTRTGAEWVKGEVTAGRRGRLALVARTAADVRDVVVEGESGILAISPKWNRPKYEPSKRRLTWPNGAIATTFSADEPDLLRGPQFDGAWGDELAAWRYREAWDNLQMALRLGNDPKAVVTTTPKPVPLVREILKDPATFITRGSTYVNIGNLAPAFIKRIIARYQGTRLGRQELLAQLLEDTPGALWTSLLLESHRVTQAPDLVRVVIGVDPSVSANPDSAETGIIGQGLGSDDHLYTLEDASIQGTPHEWATAAVAAYHKLKADLIVAEANQGGLMVEQTIRSVEGGKNLPIKLVHASRGKYTRAEPISAIYERGKAHHVGYFAELESQMTTWVPGEDSPDRMDALVWAATELTGGGEFGLLDDNLAEDLLNYRGI